MRVEYTSTPEQCEYLINRLIESKIPRLSALQYVTRFVPITTVFVIAFAFIQRHRDSFEQMATIATLLVVGLIVLPLMDHRKRRRSIAAVHDEMKRIISPGPFAVELEPEGIRVNDDGTEVLHPWNKVTAVRDTDRYIEVDINNALAIIVDHEAMSDDEREVFLATVRVNTGQ